MTELNLADDAAVVASTREDLVKVTVELNSAVTACGLTISIPKTKFLVVGSCVVQSDLDPILVGSDFLTSVASFCYLGSLVESHGRVQLELNVRISHAASVFGALRRSVFSDYMLPATTKCMVYQAVVLGVLLYAVETWPMKQREVHTLETFHHRCLRTLLGILRALQISQHISNEEVRSRVGLSVSLADMISCRRLHWLGHVARMNDNRLPKQLLFGWLPQCRPPHGVKLRWRDRVRRDLRTFHIDEAGWYVLAQDRREWHRVCKGGSSVSSTARDGRFYCDGCQRSFSRSQDKARHSCDSVWSCRAASTVSAPVASYMANVVGNINGCGLGITTCCGN